jgi:pSer/pThr/pTyr-binding forkhead associated (FHA) protein
MKVKAPASNSDVVGGGCRAPGAVGPITDFRGGVAMSRETGTGKSEGSNVAVPSGAVLIVRAGFYEGLEMPIDRDWVVVGRGRSADLVLAEPTISRAHAAIGFDPEGFYIQDLGSTNGTMVNGGRAERQVLKNGDELRMGRLVLGLTLPSQV